MKRWIAFCVALVLVIVLCVPATTDVYAKGTTGLKLSQTKVTLVKGKSTTLSVQGTQKAVKWSSSNKKVAMVNKKGKITAKKAGTAVIKAKVGSKTLTCKVKVTNYGLNKSKVELTEGKTVKLKLINAKKTVKWSSKNKKVAVVDKKGKVTAKSAGKTTITAQMSGKKYKCSITVKKVKQDETSEQSNNVSPTNQTDKDTTSSDSDSNQPSPSEPGKPELPSFSGDGVSVTYSDNVVMNDSLSETDYNIISANEINGACILLEDSTATEAMLKTLDEKQENSGKTPVVILPDKNSDGEIALLVKEIVPLDGKYLVVGEKPSLENVFDSVKISYSEQVDFDDIEWNDEYVKSTSTVSENEMKKLLSVSLNSAEDVIAPETFNGTLTGDIDVGEGLKIELVNTDFAGGAGKLSGDITMAAPHVDLSANIDTDNLEAAQINVQLTETVISTFEVEIGNSMSIYLGHKVIPLEYGFSINLIFYLEIDAQGKATIVNTTTFSGDIIYENGAATPTHDFKTSFEGTEASLSVEALINPVINLQWLGLWNEKKQEMICDVEIVGIDVFAGVGIDATLKLHDNKPNTCCELKVYPVFKFGLNCDYGIGKIIRNMNNGDDISDIEILNKDSDTKLTSKVHMEEWVVVPKCTHEEKDEGDSSDPDEGNEGVEIEWPENAEWSGEFTSEVETYYNGSPVLTTEITVTKNCILTVETRVKENTCVPDFVFDDLTDNSSVDYLALSQGRNSNSFYVYPGTYKASFYVYDEIIGMPGEGWFHAYDFKSKIYIDELEDSYQYRCNTYEDAKTKEAIPLNTSINGIIGVSQKENYYKIELENPGILKVSDNAKKDAKCWYTLFDDDGCTMDSDVYYLDHDYSRCYTLDSGIYYLRVEKNTDIVSHSCAYGFSTSYLPVEETYDYDKTSIEKVSEQEPIEFNTLIQGFCASNPDHRQNDILTKPYWYKIEVVEDTQLIILHDEVPDTLNDIDIEIYKEYKECENNQSYCSELSANTAFAQLDAGTYYLCIRFVGNIGTSLSKYKDGHTYHFEVLTIN